MVDLKKFFGPALESGQFDALPGRRPTLHLRPKGVVAPDLAQSDLHGIEQSEPTASTDDAVTGGALFAKDVDLRGHRVILGTTREGMSAPQSQITSQPASPMPPEMPISSSQTQESEMSESQMTDYEKFEQLLGEQAALNARVEAVRRAAVSSEIAAIKTKIDRLGITPKDLVFHHVVAPGPDAPRGRGAKRGTAAPKYRDPSTGETWSGRGRAPLWLRVIPQVDWGGFLIESDLVSQAASPFPDNASSGNTPSDSSSSEAPSGNASPGVSADNTPSDNLPLDNALSDNTPLDSSPSEAPSGNASPGVSADNTPSGNTPSDSSPSEVPTGNAPSDNLPSEHPPCA